MNLKNLRLYNFPEYFTKKEFFSQNRYHLGIRHTYKRTRNSIVQRTHSHYFVQIPKTLYIIHAELSRKQ